MSSINADYDSIPFHSVSDIEFVPVTQKSCLISNDMDRLSQMKFDPFQANSKIAVSQNNENLDSMYNINNINTNYRSDLCPPNSKFEMFENTINTILYKIERENKICYIAGDFNVDLLKSESCDFSNRFIEQFFTSSFFPLITKPTRITAHTATLIDNIYTNDTEKINHSINGISYQIYQTI